MNDTPSFTLDFLFIFYYWALYIEYEGHREKWSEIEDM